MKSSGKVGCRCIELTYGLKHTNMTNIHGLMVQLQVLYKTCMRYQNYSIYAKLWFSKVDNRVADRGDFFITKKECHKVEIITVYEKAFLRSAVHF